MCYGFPVKEIDYENKENEVVTINSFGERTAGQAGCRSRAPEWSDYKKDTTKLLRVWKMSML